jgi:hypothetical protein
MFITMQVPIRFIARELTCLKLTGSPTHSTAACSTIPGHPPHSKHTGLLGQMETADTDLADAATEREGRIGAAMRGRRGAVSGQAETEGIEEARHLCEYLPRALQASRSCKYP